MTIINVRGTNGSGKSTLVRSVMAKYPASDPIYGMLGPRKPEAYKLRSDQPLFLLGPYLTPAGGADCIQPYDNIIPLIEKYAQRGHVLFEGVLVSKSKGSVGTYLEKYGKQAVLLFLDTPLQVCIDAVQQRRTDRDDERKLNPKNLTEAFKACVRVRKTLLDEGVLRVMDISRENGLSTILKLLKEAAC